MLRHARPFLKEVKGSRARFAAPRVPVAAVDEVFGNDERPPRDIHDDVKPARRLHAPLDPGEAPQPFVDLDFRRSEPQPTSSNELRQRAESLFKTPAPTIADAPQPLPTGSTAPAQPIARATPPEAPIPAAEPPRRVLPDLTQQPDELTTRLEAASSRRRGRPAGSKNKTTLEAVPKRPRGRPRKVAQPTLFDTKLPTKVAQPRPVVARAEKPRPAARPPVVVSDTLPIAPLAAVLVARSVDRSTMRMRANDDATTFKPHERWKARLPIFRKLAKYL